MSHHERPDGDHHCHSEGNLRLEESAKGFSDGEKLIVRIEHWIHHNREHAASYREWAGRVKAMGREEASRVLEQVAGDTDLQNEKLAKILEMLKC